MIYEYIDLKVVAHFTSHGLNNLRRIGRILVIISIIYPNPSYLSNDSERGERK